MSTVARRKPSMPVTLNDARVMFRNFGGKQGQYNPPGKRNFVVFLPFEIARILEQDGWNIKQLKSREEGEVPQDYIKVNVKLDSYKPPKIYMINSRGRTQIDESMVDMLDWVDFGKVDLIISPYNYEVNGNEGTTAYLQTFFGIIVEDELELRYKDVPDAPDSAQNVLVWQESTPEEVESLKLLALEQ